MTVAEKSEFRILNSGRGRTGRSRLIRRTSTGFWILASGFFLLPGCTDGPQRPSGYERSERALKDPMNYSPGIEKPDKSRGDVWRSDGEGLQKDIKNVLDP